MRIPEPGVLPTSERYFFTPSALARELFYYPARCGHYFCDHRYAFHHQAETAQLYEHNSNIMLFAVLDGAMELTLNGEKQLAAAGQSVFFDCAEPYRYRGFDGLEFYWLLFDGLNARAFYRRALQAHGGRNVFAPAAFSEITRSLDELLTACAADERPSEAACSQRLHRLLCMLLLNEEDAPRAGSGWVAQAIRYMRQHLAEPLTVEDVARTVNLSPSHFSREFKSRTGYSPYEYLVLRRIDEAKHLLTSSELSVTEIADRVGYNSKENFIHAFQKNVGVSPGVFRKYPV